MGEDSPNAFWHLVLDVDLPAIRRARDKMKIALARYGRQPLNYWDDKDVSELRYWHGLLRELVDAEGVVRTITEE